MKPKLSQPMSFLFSFSTQFDTKESFESRSVMCCWIADSTNAGEGSCTDSTGCQNEDHENSPLASHTEKGE